MILPRDNDAARALFSHHQNAGSVLSIEPQLLTLLIYFLINTTQKRLEMKDGMIEATSYTYYQVS